MRGIWRWRPVQGGAVGSGFRCGLAPVGDRPPAGGFLSHGTRDQGPSMAAVVIRLHAGPVPGGYCWSIGPFLLAKDSCEVAG